MSGAAPLTVFEGRSLYLVTSEVFGRVQSWPLHGEPFSLLLSSHGSERPPFEALCELARDALAAGAMWAVCTGPWASDLEDAFLDAQAELEERREADWKEVLVSAVVEGPLAEATWQAWNLFSTGNPPLVAVFHQSDPRLEPFEELARDLQSTFEEVLEADSESS